MPSRRIVNASPLILLTRAGRLDLLRLGASEVIVPDVVISEVGAKGPDDPTARAVAGAAWMTIKAVPAMPDPVRACGLDPGESAVLALALGDADCEAVLDDRAGRLCAGRLGIACVGTLGLVLLARRLGSIPAARPVIDRLRDGGLYLDDDFVEDILARIGECGPRRIPGRIPREGSLDRPPHIRYDGGVSATNPEAWSPADERPPARPGPHGPARPRGRAAGCRLTPSPGYRSRTKEYQDCPAQWEAAPEADRELEQGRATLYTYGLRLGGDNLDRETGLPFEPIAACVVDDSIFGRADGHNARIKEHIAAHGLPANSFKRWEKEILDLKGYVATRLETEPAIPLKVDGPATKSPDGKHSVRVAKVTEKGLDGKPYEHVVLTVDEGRISDRPVSLIGLKNEPRLLWGPEGSGFAVVLYHGAWGEQAEAIDLHRGWWLRKETLSPDKP